MKIPDDCPVCGARKWNAKEYEVKNDYFENDSNGNTIFIKKGTLMQQFTCTQCEFTIKNYQKPDNFGSGGMTNTYTCGGAPGSSYAQHGTGRHFSSNIK